MLEREVGKETPEPATTCRLDHHILTTSENASSLFSLNYSTGEKIREYLEGHHKSHVGRRNCGVMTAAIGKPVSSSWYRSLILSSHLRFHAIRNNFSQMEVSSRPQLHSWIEGVTLGPIKIATAPRCPLMAAEADSTPSEINSSCDRMIIRGSALGACFRARRAQNCRR